MIQFTNAQMEKIKSSYKAKIPISQIAKKLKTTKGVITHRLIKLGIYKPYKYRTSFTSYKIKKLVKEYTSKNISIKKLALNFQVSPGYITKILKENKVYNPPKRLTNKQKNKAVQMYKKGNTIASVAKKFNIDAGYFVHYLQKHNHWKYKETRKYTCNFSFFSQINTEEKAYWLGFIGADGNIYDVCMRIQIHAKDHNHLLKFKESIKANNPIRTSISIGKSDTDPFRPKGKKIEIAKINLYSRTIVDDLAKHGLYERKTKTIKWKQITNRIPNNLIHHFVRGWFDGDGCWTGKKNMSWTVTCGSKDFIYGLQNCLIKYCKLNKTKIYIKNNTSYTLLYGGNRQTKCIYKWMYKNANIFLERKIEKAESVLFKIP